MAVKRSLLETTQPRSTSDDRRTAPEALEREPRVRSNLAVRPAPDDARPIHFPGLNGVRFLAAFVVLIYHVEVFKYFSGVPSAVASASLRVLGPQGVTCFFTLSGFLVTYLLLEEARRAGSVVIGKFYARRILRIWPLYYLVLLLGFGVAVVFAERLGFPDAVNRPLGPQLALYALLLPNLAWVSYGTLPFASVLWSVGVELQFYLGWPLLLRWFSRHALALMLTTITVLVGARLALPQLALWLQSGPEPDRAWLVALRLLDTFQLECMILGGLAAHLVHVRAERALAILYHPAAQLGALAFVPVALLVALDAGAFDDVIWGAAYALLILNVATNPRSLVNLERPSLDALGRISYGIYLYHSFAIAGVLLGLLWSKERALFDPSLPLFNLILYASSIALTFGLAALSYRVYELPFLRLKRHFTVVANESDAPRRGELRRVRAV